MSHSRTDEADALQREVRQVEDMIQQLQERRLTLLQQLNSVQASTASLPPEILSLIFECASLQKYGDPCPSAAHTHPTLLTNYSVPIFTHVSSHWRRVAWSTPKLWNTMGVTIGRRNTDSIRCILELHSRNSKALPFDLNLSFRDVHLDPSDGMEPMIFNHEYFTNIRTLSLTNPSPKWLSGVSATYPQLECLSIKYAYWPRNKLSLDPASLLHHLDLRRAEVEILRPCSSITHVVLCMIRIDTCINVVIRCPNLLYLQLACPQCPKPESTSPTDIITLHHLQTLLWQFNDTTWCDFIFNRIRLPALRVFSWSEVDHWAQPHLCVYSLFFGLPDTLLNLELADITCWTPFLFKYAFKRCRRVRDLTMKSCSGECLYAVFCKLCPGWGGDRMEYLPSLESLTVHGCSNTDNLGIDFSRRLLDICKAKHISTDPRFSLTVSGTKMDWAPGVQDELRKIAPDHLQPEFGERYTRIEV